MITVEVESAWRTPSGVKIIVLVDLVGTILQERVKITVPSYVITELLDDARVEYTTRDE